MKTEAGWRRRRPGQLIFSAGHTTSKLYTSRVDIIHSPGRGLRSEIHQSGFFTGPMTTRVRRCEPHLTTPGVALSSELLVPFPLSILGGLRDPCSNFQYRSSSTSLEFASKEWPGCNIFSTFSPLSPSPLAVGSSPFLFF